MLRDSNSKQNKSVVVQASISSSSTKSKVEAAVVCDMTGVPVAVVGVAKNNNCNGGSSSGLDSTIIMNGAKQRPLEQPHNSSHHHHHHNIIINSNNNNGMKILAEELWASTDYIFQSRLTWLLLLGPVAIVGDSLGLLSEATCFAFSGIALIPCAERLSFVTEQVAEHTNGTIGALLNATFGNAPELLISVAALRSGYYRVVQLAMLGSMITNMIFVFGVSCLIGGLRWQVQDIRLTSGNVSVGMLLVATAGSLIPATLILSGQFTDDDNNKNNPPRQLLRDADTPSREEVTLSRVNAAVMLILYLCYIVFQLGTHKDEFDEQHDEQHHKPVAQPNMFCRKLWSRVACTGISIEPASSSSLLSEDGGGVAPLHRGTKKRTSNTFTADIATSGMLKGADNSATSLGEFCDDESVDEEEALMRSVCINDESFDESGDNVGMLQSSERRRRRGNRGFKSNGGADVGATTKVNSGAVRLKHKSFDSGAKSSDDECDVSHGGARNFPDGAVSHGPVISMRVGIVWLFIITLCISAMSDILVDTIDGFAHRMKLSQVFTSMVIIPFFSNVAEQVSAFLFAYRNEMDLVVGVTIGSAIQIATFVLPGSVLIGMVMDRSMTLYFHSYETVCLFLCTVVVAAVLQGGTTNWMVGAMLIGVYIMFAAGIWFHEIENLSINTEELIDSMHHGI